MKKFVRIMSGKLKDTVPVSRRAGNRPQARAGGTLSLLPAVGTSVAGRHDVNSRDTDAVSAISRGVERLRLSSNKRNHRPLSTAGSTRLSRRGLSSASSTDVAGTALDAAALSRMLCEKQIKNVIVMAGAGISTPSGIPDFRTPGTGLYDNLRQYNLPFPEAVFDIEYFAMRPKAFFTLAKELLPGKFRPNYVHFFMRALHEKGILLRVYTQNIDGLERLAGIPASKLVEAHGTFATATCTSCGHRQEGDVVKADILLDKIPRCPVARCKGVVKPDIVFFGENLPRRFYLHEKDFPNADLVIIMGTSLEVEPFAGILQHAKRDVPRLLINRELVGPFKSKSNPRSSDVVLIGDLVENVLSFSKLLGWDKDVSLLMNDLDLRDKPTADAGAAGDGATATAAVTAASCRTREAPFQSAAHPPSCTCQSAATKSTAAFSSPLTKAIHIAAAPAYAMHAGGSAQEEAGAACASCPAAAADPGGGVAPPPESATVGGSRQAPSTVTGMGLVSARKFWMDSVASFKLPQPSALPAGTPFTSEAAAAAGPGSRSSVRGESRTPDVRADALGTATVTTGCEDVRER